VKAERGRWDRISNELLQFTKDSHAGRAALSDHPLAEMVVAEFLKPIPEHFVTGTRSIGVKYAAQPPADFVRGN